MKRQRFSFFLRGMTIVVILGMLISLTGEMPASASQKWSYIVQAATTDQATQLVEKHNGVVTSRLDIINAVGALLSTDGVAQLRLEKEIVAITPNGSVESSDNDSHGGKDHDKDKNENKDIPATDFPDVVGADNVWEDDITGSGVTVAVLDTGLGDLTVLKKSIDDESGRIVAWKDFIEGSRRPIDPNGHGSHVAGVIANSQIGADGEWNGVAPGVNLAGVRVLDETGSGTYETVISGLQWVIQNKTRYNIRIVNLSLVSPVQSPYWADPLNQAVTKTWASGITVIVAAGNSGPEAMTITVPGNNPYVVTVGAFTDNYTPDDWSDDYIAPFSGAGPTLDGFVKPDLVAPGGHIVSVVPTDSYLMTQYPANALTTKPYFKLAGTSQATAIVSGIAALVISKNPSLTPNQVKMRLTKSALPWIDEESSDALYSMWQQGSGRANAPDAVFAKITGSANQGMDIQADLAGTIHYEGYSYYDEATGTYRLYDPFTDWAGGYGTWDGGHGSWSGGHGSWAGGHGSWAGGHGSWAGGHGSWAGGHGSWAGGHGSWAGGHGSWAGGHGSWAGGYSTWAGGHGSWAGGHGSWAGSVFTDPAFIANFIAGESPDAASTNAMISYFLQDQ
ncbi:MAG: S8 family serine peptidase [Chloroflexi bacterium]|nr:S8 family serine peptidase [Chloroflexota bacterium]